MGGHELREFENKRLFKGKTEKKGSATERDRDGGRERGGEESENRSLVSPLLYFTVALLPAGDIQETAPNHMKKQMHAHISCPLQHPTSSPMSTS